MDDTGVVWGRRGVRAGDGRDARSSSVTATIPPGAATASLALLLSACTMGLADETSGVEGDRHRGRKAAEQRARLSARPEQPDEEGPRGLRPLGLESGRDGLVYVPDSYDPDDPAPFVPMLHGAFGTARSGINPFQDFADDAGCILLAPESRSRTWDLIHDDFGPDVAFIDRALTQTFRRYAIDPDHVAIEGFSDGASDALALGITNGDLFTEIVAFSPGFLMPETQRGMPRIYIAHGTANTTLPIDECSRKIVPILRGTGYDVRYHEFDGPHTVPADIASEAFDWLPPD